MPLLLGGLQDCGQDGESLRAPRQPKAAACLAMDHRLAQRPLRGVVVSPSTLLGMVSLSNHRHIGAVQEGEQSIAMLAIALAQALTGAACSLVRPTAHRRQLQSL